MKHAKKLLALAMVFAMALALAAPAFAADDDPTVSFDLGKYEVAVKLETDAPQNVDGGISQHKFVAYQIFSAEYAKQDGQNIIEGQGDPAFENTQLVAIKWGNGVKVNELWKALCTDDASPLKNQLTWSDNPETDATQNNGNANINPYAYELAQKIAKYQYDDASAQAFAKIVDQYTTEISTPQGVDLAPGYYLVVDEETLNNGETVRNPSTLQMSGTGSFNPEVKADVPQLDKNVLEVNDSNGATPDWGDVSDYDINDNVPFALTSTLPNNYDEYVRYTYRIVDTLSKGLTFDDSSVKVYKNRDLVPQSSYTVTSLKGADGSTTVTIDFGNLKESVETANYGDIIRVFYTATLNNEAVIGGIGNTNTAHLEFSRNPNATGEGDDDDTGKTPEEKVTVFTFELDINKTRENGDPLPGAEFTLFKKYSNNPVGFLDGTETVEDDGKTYYAVATLIGTGTDNSVFEFKGIDSGDYMVRETKVPDGFNKAEDIYFTVEAEITQVDNADGSITQLTVNEVTTINGTEITNVENEASFHITGDKQTGVLSTNIVNLQGLTLPSTGGIGTTIFYVVGGLLLVGAAVVLITKKRMSSAE